MGVVGADAMGERLPACHMREDQMMKYLMLLYADPAAMATATPEQMQETFAFFAELQAETTARGELVDTAGLADPTLARTVRVEGSQAVAADGPYAEFKEVIVSYAVYDLDGLDRALDIARRVAEATGDAVEVRPAMDVGGMES
jgi:hypothetical protein